MISRLKEAEQKKKDAELEVESYHKMLQDLSDKLQDVNARAAEEAQKLQTDLMEKARSNVEASRVNWYESLLRQKESLLADLGQRAGDEVHAIVRRALHDLANEDLENQTINVFTRRLRNMDAFEMDKLKNFYKTTGQQITVRSTFEIPEEMRREIQNIVNGQTGIDVKMQYEIAPELICGVEMVSHDTRIGWSIASYLNTLEANLSEVLAQKAIGEKQGIEVGKNGNARK
jgi:F-type H+-transporting ATPase subunit b